MDTPQLVSSVLEKLFDEFGMSLMQRTFKPPVFSHTRFACVFGRHVTNQQPNRPELFGMVSQGVGPKIPDHPFRGHFVSGSGWMGTRLDRNVGGKWCHQPA